MTFIELALFAVDKQDGSSTYQLGDIVSVREDGKPWNKRIKESPAFVIARVDTDLTKEQLIEQDREIYVRLPPSQWHRAVGKVAIHSIDKADLSTGAKQRDMIDVSEAILIKEATGLIEDVVDIRFLTANGEVLIGEDYSVVIKMRRRKVHLTAAQWASGRAGATVGVRANQIEDKRDAD